MSPADLAAHVDSVLSTLGTLDRAVHEKRYLRSELRHYGVSVPAIRAVVNAVCRDHAEPPAAEVIEVAEALWSRPVHECRMAAVEWLICHIDRLTPEALPAVEGFLRTANTWALVDPLATKVVSALCDRAPAPVGTQLDGWAVDGDVWLRRTALLSLLPGLRRGDGDFARFSRYADAMLDEREFFIRKAIGWVLRDAARTRPDEVAAWLEARVELLSGLTLREAVKWLPPQRAQALLTSYRAAHRQGG